jgi:RecA/RadA recombinase
MKEIEESAEDWQMGLLARLVNKAMRKWVSAMNAGSKLGRPGTMVLINQFRYTMNPYGSPTTTPGGKGQDYASSLDVKLKRDTKYEKRGFLYEEERTVAMATHFSVEKSRVCPPKLEGKYQMWLADTSEGKTGDTNDEKVVLEYGLKYGTVERKKGYTACGRVFKTQDAVMESMRNDRGFYWELRRRTIERMHDAEE